MAQNVDIDPHRHSRHSSATAQTIKLPKKLIVCCDGTWQDSDNGWVKGKWGKPGHLANPSNVTRLARAVKDVDESHHQQIVYYQAGIGTGLSLWDHIVGGGTGLGLSENIREAYTFLANNYAEHDDLVEPDSIFLLGFSRGAFTARSLGGLIGAVGILKKAAMAHFYEIFLDWENAGNPKYEPKFFKSWYEHHPEFKPARKYPDLELAHDKNRIDDYMTEYSYILRVHLGLTQEVRIKAIGVWDTVGALGIPINPLLTKIFPFLPSFIKQYKWFDTTLDHHIDYAYHALALDERRFPFSPAVWERPEKNKITELKQVWFPGAHTNIGGSYSDYGMADITQCWMMDQMGGHMIPSDKEYRDLDWIHFEDDNIEHYYELQVREYREKKEFRGWAMGKVYDSLTFPQSLAGSKVRKPGRYHRTFYDTGKTDEKTLLHDTCEYIHASVRARVDLGGNGMEPDWDQAFPRGMNFQPWFHWLYMKITRTSLAPYQPQRPKGPLEGWELQDGHKSHDQPNRELSADRGQPVKWIWKGKAAEVEKTWLEEDKLGPFERMLLSKDKNATKVEVTNEGLVKRITKAYREFRHAHTFT